MSWVSGYWSRYEATLARVRSERPQSFAALKAILDDFEPPSSGDAFFPSQAADDELYDALMDAGWRVRFVEGGYVYEARNVLGVLQFEFVEGDLYDKSPPLAGA